MSVFVDTSALLALLDADEARHEEARAIWQRLLGADVPIATTNYVLVETCALAQRRLGNSAVRVLTDDLLSMVDIEWVGMDVHERAASAVIAANRRDLSLVDAVSFEVMRRRSLNEAFAFDRTFGEAGFSLVAAD